MTPWLREQLLAYKASLGELAPLAPVFPTRAGTFRDKDNLNARVIAPVQRACAKPRSEPGLAPLPTGLSAHVFRRSYATLMAEAGAPPKYVQAQLGHESTRLTLDVTRAWPSPETVGRSVVHSTSSWQALCRAKRRPLDGVLPTNSLARTTVEGLLRQPSCLATLTCASEIPRAVPGSSGLRVRQHPAGVDQRAHPGILAGDCGLLPNSREPPVNTHHSRQPCWAGWATRCLQVGVIQLFGCLLCKQEVAGSIPAGSTGGNAC
jgi:Phage integrase family